MAKMLGNTPYRTWSIYRCACCGGRNTSEDVLYRRNQRSRERTEVRKMIREEA